MKIVYRANEPVGYWSLIPITYDAFQNFLSGKTSHEEMLIKHCLPWSIVDHDAAYLYIVGAVVPARIGSVNNAISGRVINDYLSFVSDLLGCLRIKGLVGYPSREHGYKLLKKLGFVKSNVFIENDENQPIFFLDETTVNRFRKILTDLQSQRRAPIWDAEDRKKFLDALGC